MSAARTPELPAAMRYLPSFFLLAYFLLGLGSISAHHVWGDDWAQYLMHAQALLEGRAYDDIGYRFNPEAPNVGPPSYPPGVPLLLAPVMAMAGLDLVLLKAACFACLVVSLYFLFRLLSASFGFSVASIAVALFALHDQIWGLREVIGSEAPYLLFTVAALWYATRDDGAGPQMASVREGLILGVLVYASVACRSLGVALLVALFVYGWAQHRKPRWFVALFASFTLLLILQNALLVMTPTYSNELKLPTPGLIADNLSGYWFSLGAMFRLPFGLSHLTAAGVATLTLIGIWDTCRGPAPRLHRGGTRALVARVPLVLWYMGAYLAALMLAAIGPIDRYLLPVLPFVIAFAVAGAGVVARHIARPERYALPIALALGLYYMALHVSAPRLQQHELATCAPCEELYAFVRTHTAAGAVIAFAKPRAMALMTGRSSWMWSPDYTAADLREKLHEIGADMIVIAAAGTALHNKYPPAMDFAGLAQAPGAQVVFQNVAFTAVRFSRTNPPRATGY